MCQVKIQSGENVDIVCIQEGLHIDAKTCIYFIYFYSISMYLFLENKVN